MHASSPAGKATRGRLIGLGLLLVGLAYPFVVYASMGQLSPRLFALLLGGIWLARTLSGRQTSLSRAMAAAALLFCLLLGWANSASLLLWYPVLINLALLGLFVSSLYKGMPIVERLARLSEPDLPQAAIGYTRKVTWLWVGFFMINGGITTVLALWAPLSWWTLYSGLIAYLLMGLLFAGEWLVRRRVRKAA